MISGKKRAISWKEIAHYVYTLLCNVQLIVARQLRILKSKKRAVFLNFADISHMREKTPDIPDIRDCRYFALEKNPDFKNSRIYGGTKPHTRMVYRVLAMW